MMEKEEGEGRSRRETVQKRGCVRMNKKRKEHENKTIARKARPRNVIQGEDIRFVSSRMKVKKERWGQKCLVLHCAERQRFAMKAMCIDKTKHSTENEKGTILWALLAYFRKLHILIRICPEHQDLFMCFMTLLFWFMHCDMFYYVGPVVHNTMNIKKANSS